MTPQDRNALKRLYHMMWTASCRKYTHTEEKYIPQPKPFQIMKTSQLERAIKTLFHLYGYESMKITHVAGRQIEPDQVTYNQITGEIQTITKGKYIPSAGEKGSSDLEGAVFLKDGSRTTLAIEVKNQYTQDRMRKNQHEYKAKHEADGGVYVVFRSIAEAFEWTDENLMKKINY